MGTIMPAKICTHAQSFPHVYAHMGAIIPACIYAQTGTIMPARIRTHMRNHACKHMYTCAQSFSHVYAHIGAIMPARICTHACNHFLTYTRTWARSCLQEYVHMCTIICSRIHTWGQSCLQEYVHMLWARISRFSKHTQLSAFVHDLAARLRYCLASHCSSLAVCAKDMADARPRLIVAMSTQTWSSKNIHRVNVLLSVWTKFTVVKSEVPAFMNEYLTAFPL